MKIDPITQYILKEGKNYTKPCKLNGSKVMATTFEWFKKEKVHPSKVMPRARFKEDLKMKDKDIYDLANYITTKFDVDFNDDIFDREVKTVGDFIKFFTNKKKTKNVKCP